MIIPIKLEGASGSDKAETLPVITFPRESGESILSKRDKGLGDILSPILSKYFNLRDSTRKDFRHLLAKEHPLHIETFKKDDDNDKYELQLDLRKFKPENISVKVTKDSVSILGEQEEKVDEFNYKRQQFLRRYSLPSKVNADDVTCELSSDGQLLISAPKQQTLTITEVTVPIEETDSTKDI